MSGSFDSDSKHIDLIGELGTFTGTLRSVVDGSVDLRCDVGDDATACIDAFHFSPGITIGVFMDEDTHEAILISAAGLCAKLDNRECSHMDEDYFDASIRTEMIKFRYDPITGKRIDWNAVEQFVLGRHRYHG